MGIPIDMEQPRLTPTMTSRAVLVLDFVTRWIGDHNGVSPSLDEIARGTGTNKTRVAAAVKRLAADGRLVRRPGVHRGLSLPSERDRALRLLRELGVMIDEDFLGLGAVVTFPTLPMMADPAQTAGGGCGSGDGAGAE